jgi:hypothetical protein
LPEQTIRDGFEELYHNVMKEFDPGDAPSIVSMTDRVRQLASAWPSPQCISSATAPILSAPRNVAVVGDDGAISQIPVHGGAILCTDLRR